MKLTLLAIVFFSSIAHSYSQGDTTFFDENWKECGRSGASYFRVITTNADQFVITDFFINNKPQMVATCTSINPVVKNGKCTYYKENGLKSSEGTYTDNKESGIWILWDENSSDSTVAEYNSNGTKSYLRLSRGFKSTNNNGVYEMVDEMPMFPGGNGEMNKFISDKFKLPKEDKRNGTNGMFYISFIVDENGYIVNPVIKKSISKTCDQEALRMMSEMPKWIPGKLDGQTVKVKMNIPIRIS